MASVTKGVIRGFSFTIEEDVFSGFCAYLDDYPMISVKGVTEDIAVDKLEIVIQEKGMATV